MNVCGKLRDYPVVRCEWRSCGGQGTSETGGNHEVRMLKVMLYSEDKGENSRFLTLIHPNF